MNQIEFTYPTSFELKSYNAFAYGCWLLAPVFCCCTGCLLLSFPVGGKIACCWCNINEGGSDDWCCCWCCCWLRCNSIEIPLDGITWSIDVVGIVELFMPPKIRISSTFGGNSSILISTNTRHSGHRNSEWLETITYRLEEKRKVDVWIKACLKMLRDNLAKDLPPNISDKMYAGRVILLMWYPNDPNKQNIQVNHLKFVRPWFAIVFLSSYGFL